MDVHIKKILNLTKVDKKSIEQFYMEKYNYILDIIKDFPTKDNGDEGEFDVLKEKQVDPNNLPERLYPGLYNDKKRAKTLEDLQMRIAALKGKTKLAYKEKISKKNLKNQLKKKDKKEKRKQMRSAHKAIAAFERKKARIDAKTKPIYNNGQMIFSKFDFSESGVKKCQYKNLIKDPEVALRKMKEEESKLKNLKEAGKTEIIQKIVDKKAWKTAFMKSEGVHVKDDPELLKNAIHRKKHLKDRSLKKWEDRERKVQKFKEQKQKKRAENIKARMEKKKLIQIKKATKRGKIGNITAGF